jgi:tetratricopeptide (TPR) repeat protein
MTLRPQLFVRVGAAVVIVLVALGLGWRLTSADTSARASYQQLINDGVAAQNSGDYALAASLYRDAINLRPSSSTAYFDLGDAEQFAGHAAAARYYYEQSLERNAANPDALFNLGILDLSSDPRQAATLFSRVAVLTAQLGRTTLEAESDVNLGVALIDVGHKTAGLAAKERGYLLDPRLRTNRS